MKSVNQSLIPGLPDDLALRCLAKLSHGYHGVLEAVSKRWRDLIRSSDFANYQASEGLCGNWLFLLTEESENEWIAYDPDADRWHPLPKISTLRDDCTHFGFSCICVCNRFLVIGGTYAPNESSSHQESYITNEVLQFDPFKKQWTILASMQTARSHFACAVISNKVYVAGGHNLSNTRGLNLAEVYDPVANKWEELPPMPSQQMNSSGLAYKGKFHVLSGEVLPVCIASEVFNPSDGMWYTADDIWPFSRTPEFAVQATGDDRAYTAVDLTDRIIRTRNDTGEWCYVGSTPYVLLNGCTRPLEAFRYGFAALKNQLYILGGRVLMWENSGTGRFEIVKLGVVRVCDTSVLPIEWRETRPIWGSARGFILGCACLEDNQYFCR